MQQVEAWTGEKEANSKTLITCNRKLEMEYEKVAEFKVAINNLSEELQSCRINNEETSKELVRVKDQADKDKQFITPKIAQYEEKISCISKERDLFN